jgi:hypothetical protein
MQLNATTAEKLRTLLTKQRTQRDFSFLDIWVSEDLALVLR